MLLPSSVASNACDVDVTLVILDICLRPCLRISTYWALLRTSLGLGCSSILDTSLLFVCVFGQIFPPSPLHYSAHPYTYSVEQRHVGTRMAPTERTDVEVCELPPRQRQDKCATVKLIAAASGVGSRQAAVTTTI